jgi:glycosyltransferase involved in cell wall biosynthesis
MKILVLAPKPPWPPHDGGALATLRCIEGLTAGGASVTLLTMITEKHDSPVTGRDHPPSLLPRIETVNVNTRLRLAALLSNLFFSSEPYDLVRFCSEEYTAALRVTLAREHFDIIQCEGLLFSYYVNEIRRMTDTPVVLRAHNIEHKIREMMSERVSNAAKKAYLKNLAGRVRRREHLAVEQFDAIVPISELDFQWFRSVSQDKPMMLSETGMEIAETVAEDDGDSLRVGFIGAMNWHPNIDGLRWFISEVWPAVIAKVPEASLHIAGRGSPGRMPAWMKHKGVNLEGEVDDASSFMTSMTVIIVPLFAGSGLRIKIIEAMSLGKTIVATPVAVAGIPVTDRHELFIAKDPESFSWAVIEALMNPDLRKETAAAARDLARRRYNNVVQTSMLLEFYKTVHHGS